MPVKIEPGSEPIPGYKLIERLGGGGFGEVWKSEAPGGLLKAMKFVYGELGNVSAMDDEESGRADQEKTSLERIKKVRHSYILSVERIDIIEDQLVITTELADRTTWDRFRECRNQGLPGIPREELLNYMLETAEALDFMYEEHQLQHLDVKPQNLFLVSRHIKVADFGLVKALGDRGAATITGGVTPVYAAPETFDGWLSRYSDQYSLAIVYQELLTGQRPFAGATMRQLILQHLQGEPDLSALPANDKPIIARALSKNPDHRFPTCLELARSLRSAVSYPGFHASSQGAESKPAETKSAEAKSAETMSRAQAPVEGDDVEETQARRGKRREELAEGPLEQSPVPRPSAVPSRAEIQQSRSDAETPLSGSQMATGMFRVARALRNDRTGGMERKEVGAGVVQPAVVVGLGGMGVEALRELRRLLSDEIAERGELPMIRLLGIDTDATAIQQACQGEEDFSLHGAETLLTRLHRTAHYLKPREGKLSSDSWLNPRVLYRIPRHQNAAGLRPIGRLAFTDHVRPIQRRLEAELSSCAEAALSPQNGLGVRSTTPRVYVVTSLAGNTGSGMFLDMAYLVRHLLRKQGFPYAEIIGVFLVPPVGEQGIRSADLANTYAALKELTYFSTGQAPFTARFDHPDPTQPAQTIREASPPFQRMFLVDLPEKGFGTEAALKGKLNLLAQFLQRELATPLGKATDALRPGVLDPSQPLGRSSFQTFGLFRIFWPRRQMLERAGQNLCKRLVQRWMQKKVSASAADLTTRVQQKWDDKGLRPESLIQQHQEGCERRLGKTPEHLFQSTLAALMTDLAPSDKGGGDLNVSQVIQATDALEKLLGVPEECKPQGTSAPDPGQLEEVLAEVSAKVADVAEQILAEFVVRLIEEPAYRLAGAEEALRQLTGIVERSLQTQEQLTKELQDRAASMYNRIHAILERPIAVAQQTSSSWRIGFGRKAAPAHPSPAAEILDLLRSYPKCRYQSLILHHISRLYVSLRGHLSDQIREVGFCRQRLGELSQMLGAALSEERPCDLSHEDALLPGGAKSLEDAVRRALDAVTADDLTALDHHMQELIQKDYRALVQICMGPGHVLRNLAPAMLRRTEQFLAGRLKTQSVVEMFIERAQDVDEALASAFAKAAPRADRSLLKSEISLAVVPSDASNQKIVTLLRETLPQTEHVLANRDDEIVFYREIPDVPASAIEQLGPIAQEAYRQRLAGDPASVHTREDIGDWLAPVSAT